MNRKDFLLKSSAATVSMAFLPSVFSCASKRQLYEPLIPSAGNLERVRGNVFRYVNQGGHVGLLETDEGFIIIDSQFPPTIKPLLDAIAKNGKLILYLANTHHHGDHTSGNISFKNLTNRVVAHKKVPGLQKLAAEEKKTHDQQHYPNILFDNEFKFDLKNEKVKGIHLGAGHTFGDVMYHFEKDNVVHMGDLIFINMIPVYRTKDGSNVFGWIKVLDLALAKFDDKTLFIFGHSDKPENATGTKQQLRDMRNFLEASAEFVQRKADAGMTVEEILQSHAFIPGFENRKTPQRFPDFLKGLKETIDINP